MPDYEIPGSYGNNYFNIKILRAAKGHDCGYSFPSFNKYSIPLKSWNLPGITTANGWGTGTVRFYVSVPEIFSHHKKAQAGWQR